MSKRTPYPIKCQVLRRADIAGHRAPAYPGLRLPRVLSSPCSLKPENVLIDAKGYIKLVDFGLSCHYDHLARADVIAGTPEYLPPEVFQREGEKLGRFSDWWALGNLIFEMVVGFPPFFQQN